MKSIHRWMASRSGPAMTITGQDDAGAPMKITGVTSITFGFFAAQAVTDKGERFLLQPTFSAKVEDPRADSMDFLGDDNGQRCIACDAPLLAGDMVHNEAEGGLIHAGCCGPERESYYKADGEPLDPGDPIPTPFAYLPAPAAGSEAA